MGLGTHGKVTKLVGHGVDLTGYFKSVTATGSVNTADKSLFGASAHEYQATTQPAATVAAQGLFADDTGELQSFAEAGLGTEGGVLVLPDGYDAIGRDFVAVRGTLTNHGTSPQRDDMVDNNVEWMSQVGLDIGRTLNALTTAITAAGNGTAVDFLRATANGGAAYLEVLDFTGTSVVVTIEDSADGSTGWGTIGTFASVDAAGSDQRIAITGAVKRYIRMVTTGTFSNLEAVVGFCKFAD